MNTYYISEQMLGDEATEQDARRMVELLSAQGYDVEYGDRHNTAEIADADWEAALETVSAEKYSA